MTIPVEIAREMQRTAEQLARIDAERAKLGDQLNELEIAERVLSRIGKADTTRVRNRLRDLKVSPARGTQDVSALPLYQLYEIFELDRLWDRVRQNPAEAVRLTTAFEALEVVRHTPFISEPFLLTEAPRGEFTAGMPVSGRKQPNQEKWFVYEADFGAVAAFVDLVSDLITDDTIHVFIETVKQKGAEYVLSNLAQRLGTDGGVGEDIEINEELLGLFHFLDLALDISNFLVKLKDEAFERSILSCLTLRFLPELEPFFRSVQEVSRHALSAARGVGTDQQSDPISSMWEPMDAKLGAVRDLVRKVRQNRPQARPPGLPTRIHAPSLIISEIARETQPLVQQLTQLHAERARLGDQYHELVTAERVLSRFAAQRVGRRRPARISARKREARAAQSAHTISLSDATLRAAEAHHPEGATKRASRFSRRPARR